MGNSSIPLQSIVDDAARRADLAPTLATGGSSDQPALAIATDVMQNLLKGDGDHVKAPFNWKWNRLNVVPFPIAGTLMAAIGGFGSFLTNSWQQDYAVPGVLNVSWLEMAQAIQINSQSQPKPQFRIEAVRDLEKTSDQSGRPKISYLQNYLLDYGIWGQTSQAAALGLNNPGPGVVYTVPLGPGVAPPNPVTQLIDPNGNYWVLTTFGTCGSTQPAWPAAPVFPTLANPTATATTQADGSCVWTALNPAGQGFRISPLPSQQEVVWLIRVIAQKTAPRFTTLQQFLDPIPDEYETYFRQGFFARCYLGSPDPKIRSKFGSEWQIWLKGLDNAVRAGSKEQDDYGFYPGDSIMAGGGSIDLGPAWPYAGPGPWGNF